MSRVMLAMRAARLYLARSVADTTPDYDVASRTYDEAFTSLMGPHSTAMLDRLTVGPGDDVVELACGTGHLSEQILRRQRASGTLRVVEKSPGMLAVARAKVADLPGSAGVTWREGDMLEFLGVQPDASADVIVCGWAICYSRPTQLLREARRVLRPGGRVGIIESRADALAALRTAFEHVVAEDPAILTGLIRVSLPKDAATVAGWMRKAGLSVEAEYGGEQVWPVNTPQEAVEWVERSGAGAGFRDAFDMSREAEIRELLTRALAREAGRAGGLRLTHPFVAAVGRSPRAHEPAGDGTDAGAGAVSGPR